MSDIDNKELEIVAPMNQKRTPKIFDLAFRELVFRLWCDGYSLSQITNKFKGTEREFCSTWLSLIKQEDNWAVRREAIEEDARRENDEQIKRVNREKIEVLNSLVNASAILIKKQVEEFLKNPELAIATANTKNKPLWFITKIDELEKLFKLHEFIVNNNSDKVVTDNSSVSLQQLNVSSKELDLLPQEIQSKLLKILAKKDNSDDTGS